MGRSWRSTAPAQERRPGVSTCQAHIRLAAAAAGVLAVAVGVTTAFVVGRDKPAQPAAVASPTTTSVAPGPAPKLRPGSRTRTQDHAPATPLRPPNPAREAKAAAVAFLRELGMRDPVAATYRKTGAATAEVGSHPRAGEGGRLLDQITTQVQPPLLGRLVPTGARGGRRHRGRPAPAVQPDRLAGAREQACPSPTRAPCT